MLELVLVGSGKMPFIGLLKKYFNFMHDDWLIILIKNARIH
jgi:hypothetical protein